MAMTWELAGMIVGGWFLLVLFLIIMMFIRKGSRGIKGPSSPGGGPEMRVEAEWIRRFPYEDQ